MGVRVLLFAMAAIVLVGLAVFGGWRLWWNAQFPATSSEITQLTPEKRRWLEALRTERKFQPNDYPPLGYTGAETPEDEHTATAAVDDVIDQILAGSDGPRSAADVSRLIGQAMHKVDLLATEDRDRTSGYLIEIWYILGFKGATGRFACGSGFPLPPGYGEPLPPGWTSPSEPRVIG